MLSGIRSSFTADLHRNVQIAALATLAMFAISMASAPIAELIGAQVQRMRFIADTHPRPFQVLTLVLVSPIFEELLFRRFVLASLLGWGLNFGIAAGITSILWAAFNMPDTAHGWIVYCLLGVVLSYVYYRTRSIWPCIAAHSAYNVVPAAFLLVYLR